jgi:hypothetical protein
MKQISPVLSMLRCKCKLDEENSKAWQLAQENGFDPVCAQFAEAGKATANCNNNTCQRSV